MENDARGCDGMKRKLLALCLAGVLLAGLCLPAQAATTVQDDWAIYLYLCGTDLETKGGAASQDLMEIVHQKIPDGVTVVIETGGANGMVTLDQSLVKLVNDGAITPRVALGLSRYPSQLKQRLGVV